MGRRNVLHKGTVTFSCVLKSLTGLEAGLEEVGSLVFPLCEHSGGGGFVLPRRFRMG